MSDRIIADGAGEATIERACACNSGHTFSGPASRMPTTRRYAPECARARKRVQTAEWQRRAFSKGAAR